MVSVPLTEGDNQNSSRGSPTRFYLLAALCFLSKSNEGVATEDNNRDSARGFPTEIFFIINLFVRCGISSTN